MSDNRSWFNGRRILVGGLICAALLSLPAIWHLKGYDDIWSTDYLAYAGAIVGSFTTLIAVSWQIGEEAKVRRTEHEQSVQPVIACDVDHEYEFHRFTWDFGSDPDVESKQREELATFREHDRQARRTFIVLEEKDDGSTSCSEPDDLDDCFFMSVHFDQFYGSLGNRIATFSSPYNVVPLVMRNVGVGPALRFQEAIILPVREREVRFRPPRTLAVKEECHLVLCFDCGSDALRNCSFDAVATFESVARVKYRFSQEMKVTATEDCRIKEIDVTATPVCEPV